MRLYEPPQISKKDKQDLLDVALILGDDTYTYLIDPESSEIDYDLRAKAGEVVQPLDYSKRIRSIIEQLAEGIVLTIEESGINTPGLESVTYRYPHEVYDLRKWDSNVYSYLPLYIKGQIETLVEYENKALEFVPDQDDFSEEDIIEIFEFLYMRVDNALEKSAKEEEHRLYSESLDKADLDNMYV